jgi:hypothetical protein
MKPQICQPSAKMKTTQLSEDIHIQLPSENTAAIPKYESRQADLSKLRLSRKEKAFRVALITTLDIHLIIETWRRKSARY